jgi:hypothetical protein
MFLEMANRVSEYDRIFARTFPLLSAQWNQRPATTTSAATSEHVNAVSFEENPFVIIIINHPSTSSTK